MGALLCVWLCARKHSCFTKKTGSSLGDCWLLSEILSHFSLWKTLTGSTSLFWLTTLFESCQDPCLLFEAKDCVCYLSLPYEQWALCIISSYPCFLSATLHHRPIHVQYNWTQYVISQAWVEWLASSRDTPEEVISKTEHGSSWLPFLKNWVLQSWLLLAADSPTAPQPWTHCVSVGLESCCQPFSSKPPQAWRAVWTPGLLSLHISPLCFDANSLKTNSTSFFVVFSGSLSCFCQH